MFGLCIKRANLKKKNRCSRSRAISLPQNIYNISLIIISIDKKELMKNIPGILIIVLMLIPACSIPLTQASLLTQHLERLTPGDIMSFTCLNLYPTEGEPVTLLVTIQGHAVAPFNETLTINDEFKGLVPDQSEMTLHSGNVTERQINITIGKLPAYTKAIMWYPTIVGNHTLHVIAGSFPEQRLTLSVHFDIDGIITPSLGHPRIIIKEKMNTFQVTVSEKRTVSEQPAQIIQASLKSIDGTTYYPLNLALMWRTWFSASPTTIQDELLVTYNITTIPNGFYDLTIQTTKQNYTWQHAVKIQTSEPTDYTVVQLTDLHIGKYMDVTNKVKTVTNLITYINANIHPDFVILSGDLVDWHNVKSHRNVYTDLRDALLTSQAPVYTTPGNHERYGNSFLFLYTPYYNLTSYHRYLNPLGDYSFEYGDVNYVFLDSGYDYSRWEISHFWDTTPEATGLTNIQMYLLKSTWGLGAMNQIITMHHPALNDINDTGPDKVPNTLPSGNDESIAQNRGAFIQYCIANNVSLSLAGHTHENLILNNLGEEPTNPAAWPLFIQTRSSTLSRSENGGRVIHIQNGVVTSYDYVPFT
jgi:predicted MPP superfamily phosphohydrolase